MRPIRIAVVYFMAAACAFAAVAPAQISQEQPASVTISVTDDKGNAIHDVSSERVVVFENNRPVPTLGVKDASDLPLHLGIVLLASNTKFGQEQAAAIELAQKVLRPGNDEAFVITAKGNKPWPNPHIGWLKDSAAVTEAVRALDKNAGFPDLFNYEVSTDSVGLGRMSIQHYNAQGGFSIFDVIWAMMKNDPRPARQAVVIFRLASAHSPGWGQRSSQAGDDNHNRVIAVAQSLGVSFFTIGVEDPLPTVENAQAEIANSYAPIHAGDSGNTRAYDKESVRFKELQYRAGRQNVDRIADETGGRSWWTMKKNYSDAVEGIANELAARYIVDFAGTASPATGPVRSLKVQVTGAAHVSAPRAYVAPTQQKRTKSARGQP